MDLNAAYLMNSEAFLSQLPDSSVDLILTDPPYGLFIGHHNNGWDKLDNVEQYCSEFLRVIKPQGAICVFSRLPASILWINAAGLDKFRYVWYWEKPRGANFSQVKYRPLMVIEEILVFSHSPAVYTAHGEVMTYYPQRESYKNPKVRVHQNASYTNKQTVAIRDGTRKPERVTVYDKRYPRNLLSISDDKDRGLHPTQKPTELMRYFIKTYTQKGDLVIDPFMGSGTTLVAARELGRRYAGCDIEKEYFQIAQDRLSKPFNLPLFSDDDDEEDSLGVDDMMMDIE